MLGLRSTHWYVGSLQSFFYTDQLQAQESCEECFIIHLSGAIESRSPCNGCGLSHFSLASSLPLNLRGGWSEKDGVFG